LVMLFMLCFFGIELLHLDDKTKDICMGIALIVCGVIASNFVGFGK
jgi:hypothetical protein